MTRLFISVIFGGLFVCLGAEELIVAHAPKYVIFQKQAKDLATSEVPNVVANTLGLKSELDWQGLVQGSVFKRPKANVLVTVVTDKRLNNPLQLKNLATFPVSKDLPFADMESVMNNIQRTFLEHDPLMVDMVTDNNIFDLKTEHQLFRRLPNSLLKLKDRLLDRDSVANKLESGSLNQTLTSDLSLMSELQMIDDVIGTLVKNPKVVNNKTPDLFSFTISGLRAVVDKHGPASSQAEDAKKLVTDFLHSMTDDFRKLYKDDVVIEVLTVSPTEGYVRKVRSLLAEPTPTSNGTIGPHNLADDYNELFPPIFNIALWLMIILAVTVYVIAYGMWYMDPGRDSIIYRMTSQRLKKD